MISHQYLRAPSFRWLLAWAVLLVFGAGGTAYGQVPCPRPVNSEPPAILGLGAGPGNTDRSFGYQTPTPNPGNDPTNLAALRPSMEGLLQKIGNIIPAPGEIRAIAVQNAAPNANKFIVGGNFIYRVPGTNIVYRNLMRLNPGGSVDTTFTPPSGPAIPVVNALAVHGPGPFADRIVVGCQTPGGTTPPRHVFRLLPNGALDPVFTAPPAVGVVLAVEVDPADNVYVGLDGSIGGRPFFTRLISTGALDNTGFWGPQIPPNFQTSVNGPVRAIKYTTAGAFGFPGVVVGGTFGTASGGLLNNNIVVGNIAFYDNSGFLDSIFASVNTAANGTVNALAVDNTTLLSTVFAGGEFTQFNNQPRTRVARFNNGGLDAAFNTSPGGNPNTLIPNPVRALVLTNSAATAVPPFTLLHVGGQETATAFGDVALSVTTGTVLGSALGTTSPFFPANPAVVRAMAANNSTGALFGGQFLNATAEKLVATFNTSYNPPITSGLPSFVVLGPTQFYASALLPNGDLLIGGDVGIPATDASTPDGGHVAELYRITTCGEVNLVARFRNVPGYLVRNEIDSGAFVSPPQDINDPTTPGYPFGFRRVDFVDPASIRAIAVDPEGRVYVGGQFNQVSDGPGGPFVPWNNLVRLRDATAGTIDPLFQVGQDDPTPPPGYTPIRKGGPTGFGAPGIGFTTVDPESALPLPTGTCNSPAQFFSPFPPFFSTNPFPGTGEKYNPNEGRVNAIVLQPDGKVLIGGEFKCYNEVPRGGIARLTATGSLDPTFGDSSFSLPGVGDYDLCANPGDPTALRSAVSVLYNRARVNAILLEPDGRVVVGGLFARANNVNRFNIARFNSDGTLDTGFSEGPTGTVFPTGTAGVGGGGSGATSNGRGGEIFALGRQRLVDPITGINNNGKILIGGAFDRILNPQGAAVTPIDCDAFTRFTPVGRLDNTFYGGRRVPTFPTATYNVFGLNFRATLPMPAEARVVRAIAVKSDDRPIIGGPFLIGPRNLAGTDGIGYINNRTRARIHRTGVNGEFGDALNPFLPPPPQGPPPYPVTLPQATFISTWLAVPPGVGQNPNAPLVFQPGPYAVSLPAGFGGFPPPVLPLGSLASIFAPGSTFAGVGSSGSGNSEISYYPNLPLNTTPPFGLRFLDTRMTVNTITLDPARRRAYIGGLFNTFESVRADFQNDNAGAPNGLQLDIRWPGVAALQNGSGCSYGLVLPSFPPFQPVPFGVGVNMGPVNPAGGQITIATMTRSAASLCNLQPTISTNANFVTIVGAVPKTSNPAFVDIIVNISANNTGTQRSGSITVTLPSELSSNSLAESTPEPESFTFTFTQGPASGCTFTAVAVPSSFPLAGGTGQFQITTGAGCAWNITGLPTWISASPTSGSGNGTVNFTVAANTGAPRSATVTVAGQSITITQAGTCTLTLGAATGTSLPVTGGTGSFTVTTSAGCTYTATSSAPWLVITGGASGGPTGTVTFSVGRNSGAARQATITVTTTGTPPQTQTVTVSQAPDSGADTVGMFRPSNGFFYLRYSNTSGNADIDFFYGTANDVPLSGDWNGDGITTIGIFRNGQFFLRNSNSAGFADVPAFAITGTQPGDIPIAGDWDGNGTTTVGLFRAGVFLLRNSNTAGPADIVFNYTLGVTDQLPLVGDWNGDGVTTVGLFRTSTAFFALRNTNSSGTPDLQFFFGNPNDVPVAGDWNGNGFTTIGVFRTGTFFLRNSNSSGPADLTVNYGVPTDRPVIGKWQ